MHRRLTSHLLLAIVAMFASSQVALAGSIDLSRAVVLSPETTSEPEKQAVRMLIEEVEKRTNIRWKRVTSWPVTSTPTIVVGQPETLKKYENEFASRLHERVKVNENEGYHLHVLKDDGSTVLLIGNDARGVLFAVGRLLREMTMTANQIILPDNLQIDTAPEFPIRGHQLGYRPKTNSYDGWSVSQWEQYIRDLIVFGTNSVELIPPRSDDAADSPHFPLPPMEMMVEMSQLLDNYGLDVWVWYPALDKDYSDPETVKFALNEWEDVFKKLPRIDAIFVPGGDPGHTHPTHLMALLEKQTANLHKHHPEAEMWLAPQGFNKEWMDVFYNIINNEQPEWLTGVVFGPQLRVSLPELRAAIPKKYPIRRYPDITHTRHSQYPVQYWDLAYAMTEAREPINPRPLGQARIFRVLQDYAKGFITYSEGCNDDVNKIVWSGLGWNSKASIHEILRQYSRYFIGPQYEESFAQGLLSLERNWKGPLLTNKEVDVTLQQFQAMENSASPKLLKNWRFQQGMYRAYYDAYVRSRLIYETSLEERALGALRLARESGVLPAIDEAASILENSETNPVAQDLRSEVFKWGDALHESIKMQLSVERHQAIETWRGANLDTIDLPLNNRLWLAAQFKEIKELTDENEQRTRIDRIVNWTNPGPGGFYDDLGNLTQQPHLVRGIGFHNDPSFLQSSMVGFGRINQGTHIYPISWWRHAESLNEAPLKMQYNHLNRNAEYRLRISYAGDSPITKIRLLADDHIEIHPELDKGQPIRIHEFDIPYEATKDGKLTLTWYRQKGLGGNGRGCQVAETWLMMKP